MKRHVAHAAKAAAIILIGLTCSGYCAAARGTDPPAFVADLGERVELVLAKGSAPERAVALQGFLDQVFDFPAISRFVLGPYWNSASEAQRQEFAALFGRYIGRICSSEMSDYTSHLRIIVTGSHAEADSRVLVVSQVPMPGGQAPARVDWRINSEGDGNKITDIIIEGVSLAQTQRQQFTSLIRRNSGQVGPTLVQLRQTLGAD